MSEQNDQRRRNIRTALLLAVLALGLYASFILTIGARA
jgi:hypothetical protein